LETSQIVEAKASAVSKQKRKQLLTAHRSKMHTDLNKKRVVKWCDACAIQEESTERYCRKSVV